ncbi:MFS transporter (plasmid) [Cytobacillus solani]|nr:MFS transporter [Cytobacillus solani]
MIGVLVFYALNELRTSKIEVGYIFSIASLGGLLGSLMITRAKKIFGRGKIFVGSLILDIIGMLGLFFAST